MLKNSIIIFSLIFLLLSISHAQEKIYKKNNVKEEEAQNEVKRAILSIGFSMPAIGNDPCQGVEKKMGGVEKYKPKGAQEFTGLPSKPSAPVGRQGKVMEGGTSGGEVDRDKETKEIIEELDGVMSDFLNNDNQSAEQHLSKAREINDNRTRRDMEEVKNSKNPTKEQLDRLVEDIHTGWVIGRNDDSLDRQAWQEFAKGAVRSTEYPEERKVWIQKTIYTPNPEFVSCDSPVCNKADELKRKYEKQLKASIQKGKEEKINKQEQIGGKSIDKGMLPTQTYPSQATKSGYEREKASKTDKRDPIINPSEGSASGNRGRSFDFCGRNLPTPEQAAAMGFDPGRITDPARHDWTGRIEEIGQERRLVWSKSMKDHEGNMVKVERRYTNGKLSLISYTFYNNRGKLIGTVNYNAKDLSVTGERKK